MDGQNLVSPAFKCQECGFDFVGHSEVEDFINAEHFINNVYQAVCAGAYGGLELPD